MEPETERYVDHGRGLLAWPVAALALLLLLLWSRRPAVAWMAMSAVTAATSAWLAWHHTDRTVRRLLITGLAVLAAGILAGVVAQGQLSRTQADWPREQARRTGQLANRLGLEAERLRGRGRDAADRVAVAAESGATPAAVLVDVLERTGVDAVMIFTAAGDLVAWAGEHRGQIPPPVRTGQRSAWFGEQPLYSYLYFTAPVKGSEQLAVSAVLLETAAPRQGSIRAVSFAARTDLPALFRSGGASGNDVAWSLVVDGDTVVHARVAPPEPVDVLQPASTRAARIVFGLAALSLLILSMGWLREPQARTSGMLRAAPLLLASAALAVAPLGRILGSPRAFSLEFLLPGPRPVSLGVLLAVGLPLTALAATRIRGPRRERESDAGMALALGVAALTAILVVTLRVLEYSTAASLLRGGRTLWFGLQGTVVLALTAVAALLLPGPVLRPAGREPAARRAWVAFAASLFTAVALGIATEGRLEVAHRIVPAAGALWAVPFALLGFAFRDPRVGPSGLSRWLAAGVISATAVLPQIWGGHTGARIGFAERDIASLGAGTSPFLDFMLVEFAQEAQARFIAGESGAQLVYRSWVASGLAQEPFPVHVTIWSETGEMESELGLGGAAGSAAAQEALWEHIQATHGSPLTDTVRVGTLTGVRDVSRFMTAKLDTEHFISAAVAPRYELQSEGILAPFLGGTTGPDVKLSWVSPRGSELDAPRTDWVRLPGGWRAEAIIQFPDGPRHAHLTLRVTPFWMRIARATLLLSFDLGLLAFLWLSGHLAQGMRILPGGGVPWVHTLRARITLALFVFFIVPTAVLGWISYRGLTSVVTQAGTDTATRAAQQAATEWPQVDGDLTELAAHAGAEVLYYYGGELAQASGPEALALGIHNAWMKPETYQLLQSGDESSALEDSRIGDQEYITSYARLQGAGALAVPVGIAAGVAARKQRDIAHLVLVAVVLGAMLSMLLSVVVARTLAGPIGLLQRAAAAVGAGRLSVELPEPKSDEFGQLFSSFNQMVRQLRWARAREVRSARVLAWGEMARQVAHEIKNPLTPIRLAVQHLLRAFRDGRSDFGKLLDENVDQVLTEIDRLNDISRAFSRYGAPPEEVGPLLPVDPSGVIREVLTLYRAGESGIEYLDRLASPLPLVLARADEVREVLLNLLENARDAVGDEGRVTIAGDCADGFVEIEVSDSGPGIADDLLPHIFEPHFSTRSSGTGLGLAIVQRLVEGWGGTVDASSGAGQGTSLRVRIPTADGIPCDPEGPEGLEPVPDEARPEDVGVDPASSDPAERD